MQSGPQITVDVDGVRIHEFNETVVSRHDTAAIDGLKFMEEWLEQVALRQMLKVIYKNQHPALKKVDIISFNGEIYADVQRFDSIDGGRTKLSKKDVQVVNLKEWEIKNFVDNLFNVNSVNTTFRTFIDERKNPHHGIDDKKKSKLWSFDLRNGGDFEKYLHKTPDEAFSEYKKIKIARDGTTLYHGGMYEHPSMFGAHKDNDNFYRMLTRLRTSMVFNELILMRDFGADRVVVDLSEMHASFVWVDTVEEYTPRDVFLSHQNEWKKSMNAMRKMYESGGYSASMVMNESELFDLAGKMLGEGWLARLRSQQIMDNVEIATDESQESLPLPKKRAF